MRRGQVERGESMRLRFEFKTGYNRITADIETRKNFEEIASDIWTSDEVYLIDTNHSASFRVADILDISEEPA